MSTSPVPVWKVRVLVKNVRQNIAAECNANFGFIYGLFADF